VRVTIVTRRYWPAVGGVETVAMNLGAALLADGHDVTVVAQCVDEGRFGRMTHIIRENSVFQPFEHEGVAVRQFRPSRARRALLLPFALELIPFGGRLASRWLRRYSAAYYAAVVRPVLTPLFADADVVHVLGGELMAYAAVDSARRLGVPSVISPFAHPGDWGFDSGSIRAYREADAVVATTRADAAVYRGAGVDSQRLRVIGLPVPGGVPPAAPVGTHDLPKGAPLVLFLGARRPTKGVDVLLAAAPAVWREHPNARFAFVGPGDRLGHEDPRILDVGRVSDAERAWWLERAALLCLPSSGESFGLVVAEAWSHGVPTVVSDIPVLEELVRDSGGGIAVPRRAGDLAAAITDLLSEPARAHACGEAGQAYWRANLTPEVVYRQQLAIYEELTPARTRSPAAD
jgi:glycosyltransferase involved in cell wall biosynthesis